MKKHTEIRPQHARGRPRKPQNTALISALIERQYAQARRSARKIREILDSHILLDAADLVWRRACRMARARLERIPDDYLAQRPALGDPAAVRAVLAALVREALTELADEIERPTAAELAEVRATEAADPALRRPRAVRCRTLAAARAQGARLHSQLIELKDRIAPLPPGWPCRSTRREQTTIPEED